MEFKKIHFVGIGGIGMSALADILIDRGIAVSGSDTRLNNLTEMLSLKGAGISEGHSASNFPEDADIAVRSACIRDDNPEIVEAGKRGIKIISRSELLKRVIESAGTSIGVTGTHGKTTSSGIISYITDHSGAEPTILVGGEMARFGKNSRSGRGDILVAEVDESDGYFRNISVTHALITNIEREHMENYGTMERLLDSYRDFIQKVSSKGVLVFNGEDELLSKLVAKSSAKTISFGVSGDFNAVCRIKEHMKRIEFDMSLDGKLLGTVKSPLVGLHNVSNILGAAALCAGMGMDSETILHAIKLFKGVKRRFDMVGRVGNIRIIEDYAHHPTELRSVLRAAKDLSSGRVLAVFQPHRYSRTFDLESDFAGCFKDSDVFFLTDIYSADEIPIEGAGIERLFKAIDKSGFEDARIVKKENVPSIISDIVRENDTILILGAGDIREVSEILTEAIRNKMNAHWEKVPE